MDSLSTTCTPIDAVALDVQVEDFALLVRTLWSTFDLLNLFWAQRV